jgi:hypothetical protein
MAGRAAAIRARLYDAVRRGGPATFTARSCQPAHDIFRRRPRPSTARSEPCRARNAGKRPASSRAVSSTTSTAEDLSGGQVSSGLAQAGWLTGRSFVVMLTPDLFRRHWHDRLYGRMIREYTADPAALQRDLPHLAGSDCAALSRRLGWLTFEDLRSVEPQACPWLAPADDPPRRSSRRAAPKRSTRFGTGRGAMSRNVSRSRHFGEKSEQLNARQSGL